MSSLKLKVPPLAQVVIGTALMCLIKLLSPEFQLQVRFAGAIAITLFLLGGAIALLGVAAFGSHKTTVNPLTPAKSVTLVQTGIYRYSRNPMYLGMFFMLAGVAMYLENALATLVVLPYGALRRA